MVHKVVFVRHGESVANRIKVFCGWFDTHLTDKGHQQARVAGKILKENNYTFDMGFSSALSRAKETLEGILKELSLTDIPVISSWRLNEIHLGGWTGYHVADFIADHSIKAFRDLHAGADQDIPPMKHDHQYYEVITKNPAYSNELKEEDVPKRETFSLVMKRSVPFWEGTIVPEIRKGKRVIIASHKLTLKGLIRHIEQVPHEKIAGLDIPNSTPFVYELDDNMKPVKPVKFLTKPNIER